MSFEDNSGKKYIFWKGIQTFSSTKIKKKFLMVSKSKKTLKMMMVVKRSLITDSESTKKKQKNFKNKQKT